MDKYLQISVLLFVLNGRAIQGNIHISLVSFTKHEFSIYISLRIL